MKTEIEMNKEASPNASLTELRFWGFIAILLAILTLWNTWTRPAQVDCAAADNAHINAPANLGD
jgi:hypothetical protein